MQINSHINLHLCIKNIHKDLLKKSFQADGN